MNNLAVPVASGLLFSSADSYFSQGSFVPNSPQNGVQQAVATFAAPKAIDQLYSYGLNLPIDREYSEPLITAGLYYIFDKYVGSASASSRTYLLSGGSAYAAKMIVGSATKNSGQSQIIGSVVPPVGRPVSRVTG